LRFPGTPEPAKDAKRPPERLLKTCRYVASVASRMAYSLSWACAMTPEFSSITCCTLGTTQARVLGAACQ